ncbi:MULTISPECIES: DUF4129 domain-containing protein [unclassified Mycobacterium]|uniref:DUF4129 domain-containing protein n=1 Tax=unclassified Mycobacterium TaxID=2642494 RepID=UPI0007FDB160|nr:MULTISPECIES: DUF4129 domain-containing protein [unclassified Mycobacterium]OBH00347.1 hypothetical protein A5696_16520 [Mycobacterium sp. E2699]OBI48745.1 hypothetical protein A5705_15395 [Mycobacterium sp. E787]
MPGIDKPTGRVVALLVLMIFVAAALRGYLPAQGHGSRAEPGGGRAALLFVIVTLSATLALLAIAVIARLRDPRAMAPKQEDLSDMLGTGKGRPSWRVLLIGLALIVAWLLIATLLIHYLMPHDVNPAAPGPAPAAQPSGRPGGQPAQQHPQNNSGDMFGVLLAGAIPMMVVIVAGSVIMARRRWRGAGVAAAHADDHFESPAATAPSESLVRAAEVGLAEIGDLSREPREAIIACYAAMERELANVPGAAPQDFDTPTEVLVRAVEHHALQADNAERLVNLFEEARFSPHVMSEEHREVAVNVLRLVLAELRSPV